MKRALQLAGVFLIAIQVLSSPVAAAAETQSLVANTEDPPLILPHLLINKVVAGISGQTSYEYIELHNPNPHDVVLESWKLSIFRKEGDLKQELLINGTVKANGYLLVAGVDPAFNDSHDLRLKANTIVTTGGIVELSNALNVVEGQIRWGDIVPSELSLGTGNILNRNYTDTIPSLTGNETIDFTSQPLGTILPRNGDYVPYIEPVYRCEGVIISEIAANVPADKQFIELYNASNSAVDLDGCLLQTNRSTTVSEALSGALQPGAYKTIYIADTDLTLTKTTTGTVYILSSDGEEETDAQSYDGLGENTSWAWFGDNDWRQTFAITPGGVNAWQEFLPCESGYERNAETGRCRKVVVAAAASDCGPGKYRNPETNRCRSVMAANALTPCKTGQYRSPETNRCRSATAASALKPCKQGQKRNSETNRCRNVADKIPNAAFSVEPIAETGKAFMGWWALGGVGVLAVGYGVWEWRREVFDAIKKFGTFFTSGK